MGFEIKTVICVRLIGDLISVLKYTWHWKLIITETQADSTFYAYGKSSLDWCSFT